MGSGRGQSRRALAAAAVAGVELDVDKWTAFVKDQNIGNVKLLDYYKIKFPPGIDGLLIAPPQLIESATEFFRDLVDVGAITLPVGVGVDDFEFDVDMVKPHMSSSYEVGVLLIRNKKTNDEMECSSMPYYALSHKANLSSNYLLILARAIGVSARLISTPKV